MTRTSLLKRFGAFLLALMMCVSLFPVSAFAEGEENTEPPHEHSWTDWTVTKAATCTEAGEQLHTCTACGASGTEPVPAIPHTYGDWTVTKAATCTEAGERQHACTVCGATEAESVPAIPHTYGEWTVTKAATCTEAGERQHACTVCSATEAEPVPAIPHTYGDWTVMKAATCTEAGEQQRACTVCGATETAEVPLIPHTYGDWTVTKAATCTEAGEQEHACTVCGATETAAVPVIPHTFGGWTVTKEATCTETGKQERACTVCGEVEKESIPVIPHSFGDWEVTREASCTKEGKQEHTCAVCGEVEKESIPVIPHSFGDWEITREPTCTKEGKREHTCTVCGEVKKESIPVIPHSFGDWEITREATCTKEGRQEHTCTVCGEVEKESIPMIPHSFGEWEVTREATCIREGKKERVCSACGETEKEAIPVTEHDWDEDDVCTICGAKKEKATYTVLWLNEDGKELEKDEKVPEGDFPSFDGKTPARDEDDDYTYEFSGWTPEPAPVTEDAVYTAQFAKTERRSDAMDKTETVGNLVVSVSAPEGAFPRGTEITIASAAVDVSSIDENAELVGAAQLGFVKNGETQTAESPVAVSVSMLDARNEQDTYKAFQNQNGTVIARDYGSSFSVTEAAAFGVARIPAEPVTLTFDPDNGEEPILVSVEAGSAIGEENMPADPVKENCDFEKWVDADDENTVITAGTVVTGDMTVKAVYKRRMPAVSFHKSTGGVYVAVTAEEGTFPAGTEMTVVPLGSDSFLESLSNAQDGEVVATLMVDITFWLEGEEIQPEKPVAVTLNVGKYADDQSIDVVHFANGGMSVVASDIAGSAASFAADHFSPYGVIVTAKAPLGEDKYVKSFEDFKDETWYYILGQSEKSAKNSYYLMDGSETNTSTGHSITVITRTAANDIGSAVKYKFVKCKDSDGKILYNDAGEILYTIQAENEMFLTFTTEINDKFGKVKCLELTATGTQFTVTIKENTGEVTIQDKDGFCLNLKSQDSGVGFQGFIPKDPSTASNDPIKLVPCDQIIPANINDTNGDNNDSNSAEDEYEDPYELKGKDYAIIYYDSNGTAKALTYTLNKGKLETIDVTVSKVDGKPSILETEVVTWTFVKKDADSNNPKDVGGHYYLSASNGQGVQYVKFSEEGISLVGNEEEATVIAVSPGSTGGKIDNSNQKPTQGRYRFTWPEAGEKYSVTLQVDKNTNTVELYGFGNDNSNSGAQQNETQWFYLAAPARLVTYKFNGDVPTSAPLPDPDACFYHDTVPRPKVQEVEGYHFDGWVGDVIMPDKDITITGNWTANTDTEYTVKHWQQNLPGDGYELAYTESKTGTTGTQTEAKAKTYTGFAAKPFEQATIAGDGNTVVNIYYDRVSYNVTYDYGKAPTGASTLPAKASYKYGAEVKVAADATAPGYTFGGWSTSDATISGGKFTMPAKNVKISGTFSANTYTVKFDKNAANATGTMADQSFKYDEQKALTANAFRRTGYTFRGWGESATATTVKYADKAAVKNLVSKDGGSVTLYAIWEAETEVIVTISAVQDTVLYDGMPHTVIGFLAQSNNVEYNRNIDNNYRFTGNVELTRTNAGTDTLDLQTLTFQNTNTNFPNVTFQVNPNSRYNSLTVNPRTVIMTSASAEKEYDGEPLTSETVTVTGDGFAAGQGATYTFSGTQTEEGSSQNSFTYTLTGGALPGNYNITSNFGTLRVLGAEVIEEPEPPLAPPAEEEVIEDDETPQAAPGGWALVNLVSMVLTACTAGGMLATYRKRKGEDDDPLRDSDEIERKKSKFLGLIPGLGSIATFFLTEDLNSRMVLTDHWTVLMLAILGIAAALAWLTRNDEPKEDLGEI